MRSIHSFYIHNVGYNYLWFDDFFIDLSIHSELPNSVLGGENGVGKTTCLSFLFSTLKPERNNFLHLFKHPHSRFEDYLDSDFYHPGVVLIEFDGGKYEVEGDDQYELFENRDRLVVGQIVCLPKVKGADLFRKFFSFRCKNGLSMNRIKEGIEGSVPPLKSLTSIEEAKDWFRQMQRYGLDREHPGDFFSTDKQNKWIEHLRKARTIDPEIIELQWTFNKSEGGDQMRSLFTYTSELDFIQKFFKLCLNEEKCEKMRAALKENIEDLSALPLYQEQLKAFTEIQSRFIPFKDAAEKLTGQTREATRIEAEAKGLREALNLKLQEIEQTSQRLNTEKQQLFTENGVLGEELTDTLAHKAGLEQFLLERAIVTAKKLHEQARGLRDQSALQLRTAEARKVLEKIDSERTAIKGIEEQLKLANAEIEEYTISVEMAGGAYKSALNKEILSLSAKKEKASDVVNCLTKAENKIEELTEKKRHEREGCAVKIERIESMLTESYEKLNCLLELGVLTPNESLLECHNRWKREVETSQAAISTFEEKQKKLSDEYSNKLEEHKKAIAQLEKSRAEYNNKDKELGAIEDQGRKLLRSFVDSGIGVDQKADIFSALVAQRLDEKRLYLHKKVSSISLERSRHVADQSSINKFEVLGVDHSVSLVLQELAQIGVQASSHSQYLSSIYKNDPDLARDVFMSDPGRFSGVQVNDDEALLRAQAIRGMKLDRPVVISTPAKGKSLKPSEKCLVIAPEGHALYNKEAAFDYRSRLMKCIDKSDSEIISAREELDVFLSLSGEFQQYVRRYGQGRILTIRSEVEVAKNHYEAQNKLENSLKKACESLKVTLDSLPEKKSLLVEQLDSANSSFSRIYSYRTRYDSKFSSSENELIEAQEQLANIDESLESLKKALIKARSVREEYRETESGLLQKISPYNAAIDDIEYATAGVSDEGQSVDALKNVYLEKLKSLHRKESGKVADYRTTLKTHQDYLEDHNKDFKQYADIEESNIRAVALDDIDFTIKKIKKRLSVNDNAVGERFTKIEDAKTTLSIQKNQWISASITPIEPVIPDDMEEREVNTLIKSTKRDSEELEGKIEAKKTKISGIESIEGDLLNESRVYNQAYDKINALEFSEKIIAGEVHTPSSERAVKEAKALYERTKTVRNTIAKTTTKAHRKFLQFLPFLEADNIKRHAARECEMMLRDGRNDFDSFLKDAEEKYRIISDRITLLSNSIETHEDKVSDCASILSGKIKSVVKRLSTASSITVPDNVPVLGGQKIIDMNLSKFNKHTPVQEYLKKFVRKLAGAEGAMESGQSILAKAFWQIVTDEGINLNIKLLKPIPQVSKYEHLPIDKFGSSDGEGLTSALMLYLLIVKMRGIEQRRDLEYSGALILDNPLGKANSPILLKAQLELAKYINVQLIYFTCTNEQQSLNHFAHVVSIRVSDNEESQTGRKYLECMWGEMVDNE